MKTTNTPAAHVPTLVVKWLCDPHAPSNVVSDSYISSQQVIARHEGHLDMEGQLGFLQKVPGFE